MFSDGELKALEKLSYEHPAPLLKAGALASILSFLDFFPIGMTPFPHPNIVLKPTSMTDAILYLTSLLCRYTTEGCCHRCKRMQASPKRPSPDAGGYHSGFDQSATIL